MRFQKSQPPPSAFGGRDRVIVFLFFGVLAGFFAIKLGSDPKFWKAMRGEPAKPQTADANRITIDPSALRPDENRFAPPSETSPFGTQPEARIDIETAADLTIPKSDLKSVRDHTLGVRASEIPSYYATLKFARELSPIDMQEKARDIPYTMLMAEPWLHRGKLVSIEGRLRRLVPIPANANQVGVDQLYDAWVFTKDSGSSPVHVVCSAVPADLQPANLYSNNPPEVKLSGYFFKTQGYQSVGDGKREATLHIAPLVLAGSISHIPAVVTKTRDVASEMVPWLTWFALGTGGVLTLVLWNFAASDWAFRHTRAHGLLQPEATPVDFHGVDALSTDEMLHQLSSDSHDNSYLVDAAFQYSDENILPYDDHTYEQ